MAKISAGLIMYRTGNERLQVLLVHPGGPFWARKDAGVWTFPRGEIAEGEELLIAAIREFQEETGYTAKGPFIPLGQIKQKSGKVVHAWAFEGDCDPASLKSNAFELEWPPKSGRMCQFPEVD